MSGRVKEKTISISQERLEELLKSGEQYRRKLFSRPDSRYRSWEHCYAIFAANRKAEDEATKALLTLHLTGYLASWGMYRGKSFLLQDRDYLVHRPIVDLLLKPEWEELWYPSAKWLAQTDNAHRVVELGREIDGLYRQIAGRKKEITDTLVTKILLGTLGCSPAYDTNFKNAVSALRCGVGVFNGESLSAFGRFYEEHADVFEPFRVSCNHDGIEYLPMKVLDMCFFADGERN